MSDPTQNRGEPDDLDLDAEIVRDLEPDDDDVRGGRAAGDTTGKYCNQAGSASGCTGCACTS
jgi:hypothetical protein